MNMKNLANPSSIISHITIALLALLPIFFLPFSWVGILQSKMLLVSLCVLAVSVVYGYARYRESIMHFPRSVLALSVLSLPLVYMLSALVAGAAPSSFVSGMGEQDTVGVMVLFYALFMLGALTFKSAQSAARIFLRATIAGSLALMLVQVLHVLVPGISLGVLSAAASSVFGSWHEVSVIAGLSILFTVALWNSEVLESFWKWLALALSMLSAVMLVVVNMVDVWMTFGGLMILFALYAWHSKRGAVTIATSVVIGVAALSCAYFGAAIYQNLPAKLQVLQVEVRPSWRGTFAIGKESIVGARTALLGSGPNTFTQQWSLYKPAGVNTTEYWNIDFNAGVGFIPTTFVTVGILGLLAWASLLGALLWSLWRFIRRGAGDSYEHAALLFGALYLGAFHIVYVPTVVLSALTFLLFGVLASADGVRSWSLGFSSETWKGRVRTALFALTILAIIVASLGAFRATVSEILVNRSGAAYRKNSDAVQALSLLQAALLVYPNNDRAHRAAVELGLIRLGELVAAGDTTDQATAVLQVSLETTIQHGLAAVSINSGDYQNWLALAGLYKNLAGAGVQGAFENAEAAFEKASADNPLSPLPLVQRAQLYIARDDLPQAIMLLDRAISLKSNFAAAYLLRSQVHAALGNREASVKDAAAVAQIAPEDSISWYNLGAILYDAGSYVEAAQSLEKAVALQNNYANALFLLGLSYEKLGRPEDALVMLERAARTNPGDAALAGIIENIRAGLPSEGGENTR